MNDIDLLLFPSRESYLCFHNTKIFVKIYLNYAKKNSKQPPNVPLKAYAVNINLAR